MRRRRVCVAALLSVILVPASAFAATYYASPDGSGDGTSESSPASVSAAVDNAQHALVRFAHPLVRLFDLRTVPQQLLGGRIFSPRGCNDPDAEEETLRWQAPDSLAQQRAAIALQ